MNVEVVRCAGCGRIVAKRYPSYVEIKRDLGAVRITGRAEIICHHVLVSKPIRVYCFAHTVVDCTPLPPVA